MTTELPSASVDAPLDEQAWSDLRELAGRYPQARSALLPMLHLVQSVQGRITPEGISACADVLGLTDAEVSGVATFYTMYKRKPMGKHHVGVCVNTLCAIMGGDEIWDKLTDHLGVGNDETSEDGQITLERVECNAACDYAPVAMVNWEFFDNQTPESLIDTVDKLRAGETVVSSRGATITSWREAERVIGGFEDGLVDEGPTAGEASLIGVKLARENGWAAPEGWIQSGGKAPAQTKAEAVAQADTSRAESETIAEDSKADVEGGGSDD